MRKPVLLVLVLVAAVAFSGCFRRKKYENPITTDSVQPDKTLFERAQGDLEKSRYEVARLTLQTLMNTYPDSEYLAKAKLAIADSWYRQGGTSGLAQAEAEYKDFITFFPTMEEAVEAQLKVAMIHYQQMEKPDRDATHTRRAEQEFKQLLLQFTDSKFTEEARQRLREVQEVLAESEFRVGYQYYVKGSNRSAVGRLKPITENFPYFSRSDEALMLLGDTYDRSGKDFRDQAAAAYSKVVSDYPLSPYVEDAKDRLTTWNLPVPAAKPEAIARMQFEMEHREKETMSAKALGIMKKSPQASILSAQGQTHDPLIVNNAPPPSAAEIAPAGGVTGTVVLEPVSGGPPVGAREIVPGAKKEGETVAPAQTPAQVPAAGAKPRDSESSSKKKKKKLLGIPVPGKRK